MLKHVTRAAERAIVYRNHCNAVQVNSYIINCNGPFKVGLSKKCHTKILKNSDRNMQKILCKISKFHQKMPVIFLINHYDSLIWSNAQRSGGSRGKARHTNWKWRRRNN